MNNTPDLHVMAKDELRLLSQLGRSPWRNIYTPQGRITQQEPIGVGAWRTEMLVVGLDELIRFGTVITTISGSWEAVRLGVFTMDGLSAPAWVHPQLLPLEVWPPDLSFADLLTSSAPPRLFLLRACQIGSSRGVTQSIICDIGVEAVLPNGSRIVISPSVHAVGALTIGSKLSSMSGYDGDVSRIVL